MPTPLVARFALDPTLLQLNHGSFGACPRVVLAAQDALRARMEADPLRFLDGEAFALLDRARRAIAALLRAQPEGLVFVRNATSAVNAVLASFPFAPGDQILTTDHVYPACLNALRHWGGRGGAEVVVARVPFPIAHPDEVLEAVLGAVGPRTRLALLDHVTSPTGLVFPVEQLVPALEARGVAVLVDGAHAPGMLPLDLDALGASYYTGNLHKWLCAPKGTAVLWSREDRRAALHPTGISHGLGQGLAAEFDWTGTDDPTGWLAVPDALEAVSTLVPGGLAGLMAQNRALALEAQGLLADALAIERPAPASMIGALAAVPLPSRPGLPWPDPRRDALETALRARVPFFDWPRGQGRLLRVSAQCYVAREDVVAVADWLRAHAALDA